ncbi:hypothetical protein C0J52_28408 [Blattella germanica]|nr:hypothetical protein C0J52_28408 [Blattella germanica]
MQQRWRACYSRPPVRSREVLFDFCGPKGINSVKFPGTCVACMERRNVSKWCTFFQEERVNLSDSPRSGRPTTAATPQNVRGIEAAILNDRRVLLRALSQKFNISYGAVYDIVHENLKFRKVSARWMPKNLTDDHKDQRMMASLDHLTRYTAQGHDFLEGIVTGDESPTKIEQHFSAPDRWMTVACAPSLLHRSSISR